MSPTFIGKPLARIDGRAKVTGAARLAAEFNQPGQAHAVIVSAAVGLGRLTFRRRGARAGHAGRVRGAQP